MKQLILTISLFFFTGNANLFSQSLYYTDFETDEGKAGWQQYKTRNGDPKYQWKFFKFKDNVTLYHSGNNVAGVADTITDWMVSPAFVFSSEPNLSFKFYGAGIETYLSNCKVYFSGGNPDPSAGDYIEIADITKYNYRWIDTNFHIPYTAEIGYIAFRFYIVDKGWFSIHIDSLTITAPLSSLIEKDISAQFIVYPNPVIEGKLIIENPECVIKEGEQIVITDMTGKKVIVSSFSSSKKELDVSSLASGMYIIQIGKVRKKIIKTSS